VDAQRFLTSVEHSKQTGGYVDLAAGRVPFRDYAGQWRLAQPHRHGTIVAVEQHLRLHVYPIIGSRPMAAVRPSEIQAMVSALAQTLAPSTLAVVYGRVVAVFRAAERDRVIATTPCVGIRLPSARGVSAVTEVLTIKQVTALAEAAPPRYRAVILAGGGLGPRPGELFGLALDSVDFLERQVRVEQQLVRVRGQGVVIGPLKTPSSYRSVPLPEPIARAIATHLDAFGTHPVLRLVFTNERGEPIQQYPFSQVFTNAARKAGLPAWATPHDLRHFYASTLIRSGASVKVVQARLGHASAKTTLDVYGHLFPDEEDRTRQAIEAAFDTEAGADDEVGQG
ncbi:MAG: tyrosine-type recombinase/integrase, partial [Acidimicrobiales bacterium]